MFDAKKFATVVAFIATLALAPCAFAQVAAGYAIQLGQTAGTARQMPHLDPRAGFGPQDYRAPSSSAGPQDHRGRHHVVRDDDDDYQSPADAAADRSSDWIQVK